STAMDQPPPRALTRSLERDERRRLEARLPSRHLKSATIEEVVEHPLLTLLRQVNPVHNSFDRWELTELYLEVHGSAFWLLDLDPLLGTPTNIWILPTQRVTPRREPDSRSLVDYYEYRGQTVERFGPERVVHFRFPDPRDPYTSGLSP